MRNKRTIIMAVVVILCVSMVRLADASYTILKNDTTHYDYANHDGSIWGFGSITHYTSNGEMSVLGQTPWWGGTHTCRVDMWMTFTASENGKVYCQAKWSMSYRLEAVTSNYTRSELWIYYVLYNSGKSQIETSTPVYHAMAYKSGSDAIVQAVVNEDYQQTRQFQTVLNQGSTYWVSVRVYLEIYGTYAHVYAYGGVGSPLTFDVNGLKVYR